MSVSEVIVLEEADRQFEFIQALKKLDFYAARNLFHFKGEEDELNDDVYEDEDKSSANETNRSEMRSTSRRSQLEERSVIKLDDDLQEEDEDDVFETQSDVNTSKTPPKTIDLINSKISRLNDLFDSFDLIKPIDPPSTYAKKPDARELENLAIRKEIEHKHADRFAGVYSLKTVVYDLKTDIPLTLAMRDADKESSKDKPRLVELYQFSQYDKKIRISLPHGISLTDVLKKVLRSMDLSKQTSYRKFLYKHFFSKPCKYVIHDTFWWCFLERYQKIESIQHTYFDRVARNYVRLIFTEMDPNYRDTFLKSFPTLLAMSVYTIFGTCFPQSHMTHFNEPFKEFVCSVAWMWVAGCRPSARSFADWNFPALDPPTAVFAQQVLDKKNENNVVNEIEKLGTSYYFQQSSSNFAAAPSSTTDKKSSMSSDKRLSRRRGALLPTDIEDIISKKSSSVVLGRKIFQSAQQDESHPIGRGAEFDESLFDLLGHSPLVDYFLYKHHARKINNAETLVQHSNLVSLPPLGAPTYRDFVNETSRRIKKSEEKFKVTDAKNKNELEKLEKTRVDSMREFNRKREKLLNNRKEVKILGDLIMMNHKKDPNSVGSNMETALRKAFRNSSLRGKH